MSTCRQIEALLLSEPDGTLDATGLAQLEAHAAECPDCRRQRALLSAATVVLKQTHAAVSVPSAREEWLTLRDRLRAGRGDRVAAGKPAMTPWLYWGIRTAALGAAAAIAFIAYLRQSLPAPFPSGGAIARAEFVQADNAASTLVYVDQDSGWLIVWADSPNGNGRG